MENVSELHSWYAKQVKSKRQSVQSISSSVNTYLWLSFFIFIFFQGLAIAALSIGNGNRSASMAGITGASALILPAFIVGLLESSKKKLIEETDSAIASCKFLPREQLGDIYACCDHLINKMNLGEVKYTILYWKDNSFFPVILERFDTHYLIIPRNFVTLFYKNLDQARAILCHEFAHVLQHDAQDHLFNSLFAPRFRDLAFILIMLFVILPFIVGIATERFTGLYPGAIIAMPIGSALSVFLVYSIVRIESENLADVCVLVHDDGRPLAEALRRYAVPDSTDVTHESPAQRVQRLNKLIEKYKLYAATP